MRTRGSRSCLFVLTLVPGTAAMGQTCGYLGWALINPTQLGERHSFQMVYDQRRAAPVLFGGASGNWPDVDLKGTTLRLEGDEWVTITGGVPPVPRLDLSLSYDSVRGVVLLTGGASLEAVGNHHVGGTFELDASGWTLRTMGGVNARHNAAMAFDTARGRTTLFGGKHIDPGTWEWDGIVWRNVTPATPSPVSRNLAGFAYDESRGRSVLFAGGDVAYNPYGDTWEWDGANWEEKTTTGPTARLGHGMTYDSFRRRTVLYSGQDRVVGRRNDVWEWDGAAWVQASVPGAFPTPRQAFGFAYDRHRNRFIAAGGQVLSGGLSDTWELRGDPYVQTPPAGATVGEGDTAVFSIGVLHAAPYSVRWRRGGVPLADDGRITGSGGTTLSIGAVTSGDAGAYDAVLTNACGSFVTIAAVLGVPCPADFNRDGGVDGADVDDFYAQWEIGNADFNQDGGVDGADVDAFFSRWEGGC